MKISDFLGKHASVLLKTEPFNKWPVERSTEDDLEEPIIQYVFGGHAMALRCDRDDAIRVIFLRADKHNKLDGNLFDVPFFWTREKVLNYFGTASKSGAKVIDPILGDYGAWDRFSLKGYTVHVEYRIDRDEVKRITLEADPKGSGNA